MICSWIFSLLYNNWILQSFAACFLLTEYSFQFQVWLIAYFYRTKLHLVAMEKALLVDVVFDMQHAKV